MKTFETRQILNGTYGIVVINGKYAAEVYACEAKDKLNKESVQQAGKLRKGDKVTSVEGSGTLKWRKVSSYLQTAFLDAIAKGKTPTFEIISTVDDPDAIGKEKVKLTGCVPDEISHINWEAEKLIDQSMGFTYSGVSYINTIKDNG